MLRSVPGTGNADDGGNTPTHVAALQRFTHDVNVTDTLERVINAAVGHFDNGLGGGAAEFFGIHEIGCAQCLGHFPFGGVDVDGDDAAGFGHDGALNR